MRILVEREGRPRRRASSNANTTLPPKLVVRAPPLSSPTSRMDNALGPSIYDVRIKGGGEGVGQKYHKFANKKYKL